MSVTGRLLRPNYFDVVWFYDHKTEIKAYFLTRLLNSDQVFVQDFDKKTHCSSHGKAVSLCSVGISRTNCLVFPDSVSSSDGIFCRRPMHFWCPWSASLYWWSNSIQSFIPRCITSVTLPLSKCSWQSAVMPPSFPTSCQELVSDQSVCLFIYWSNSQHMQQQHYNKWTVANWHEYEKARR